MQYPLNEINAKTLSLFSSPSTWTVKEAIAIFPAESTAVYVTVVSPIGKYAPDGKFDVTVQLPPLSVTIGSSHVICAVCSPKAILLIIGCRTCLKTGFSLSVIIKKIYYY